MSDATSPPRARRGSAIRAIVESANDYGPGAEAETIDRWTDEVLAEMQPAEGQPSIDEALLRREALDAAVRSQRGVESGPELVVRAESLLAFLRGEAPSREAQEDVAYRAAGR